MIELYDYQNQYISSLKDAMKRGKRRLVLCAPTGAGKTVMFTYMVANSIKKGNRVIVFTHRKELLTQAGGTFSKFGLEPEFIEANKTPNLDAQLHVAMVETFNRRISTYELILSRKDLIIFDEAHLQNFTKLFPYISKKSYVIGATATPYRKPIEAQMSEFYEDLIQNMDTLDVIEQGKLCMAKSYGVIIDMKGLKKQGDDYDTSQYYEENKTYEGVLENYEKYSKGLKTILFASNIANSKQVCGHFISKGYDAKHIDGTTPKNDRQDILQWFANTKDAILCNCGVLTAGFDQPDIHTVILYRATTSLPLFLQMCGRGSRIYPNKTHFNILDFGNNIQRLGFWQDRRIWQLKYERKKAVGAAPIKCCPKCDYMMPASTMECPECGYLFQKKEKDDPEKVILSELEWLKKEQRKVSELSIDDLIRLQKLKKWKPSFVWRVIRSRGINILRIYANKMNYTDSWVNYQQGLMNDIEYKDFIVKL